MVEIGGQPGVNASSENREGRGGLPRSSRVFRFLSVLLVAAAVLTVFFSLNGMARRKSSPGEGGVAPRLAANTVRRDEKFASSRGDNCGAPDPVTSSGDSSAPEGTPEPRGAKGPSQDESQWVASVLANDDVWFQAHAVGHNVCGVTYQSLRLPFSSARDLVVRVYPNQSLRVAFQLEGNEDFPPLEGVAFTAELLEYALGTAVAASAYATDPDLLATFTREMKRRGDSGEHHGDFYLKKMVLALGAAPGLLAKYVQDDHDCDSFPPPNGGLEWAMEAGAEAAWKRGENLIPAFEAHTLRCRFCREHPDSHMAKLLGQMREWQATEDRAIEQASAVLAKEPKFWVVGVRGSNKVKAESDVRDVLDAVRRTRATRFASEVRAALEILRAAFNAPEEPNEFEDGPFKSGYWLRERFYAGDWRAPEWLSKEYEVSLDGITWVQGERVLNPRRDNVQYLALSIGDLIDRFIWTLFKIDAPMTEWERKLLYHHRLIGDPKEHLRAAGFALPGDPPAPAPANDGDGK
ncbi:MAG: hypothetical protein HY719_13120 [Planctomycetes bacterium]|nr:hypothetical protein [Planctomycetota bacterium]